MDSNLHSRMPLLKMATDITALEFKSIQIHLGFFLLSHVSTRLQSSTTVPCVSHLCHIRVTFKYPVQSEMFDSNPFIGEKILKSINHLEKLVRLGGINEGPWHSAVAVPPRWTWTGNIRKLRWRSTDGTKAVRVSARSRRRWEGNANAKMASKMFMCSIGSKEEKHQLLMSLHSLCYQEHQRSLWGAVHHLWQDIDAQLVSQNQDFSHTYGFFT